jgi:hypothetical protein
MQTEYTPAPWKAIQDGNWFVVAENALICSTDSNDAADKANAKLIATAPELLQAVANLPDVLRKAAEVLEMYANRIGATNALNPKLNWYADKIEAAINKATAL